MLYFPVDPPAKMREAIARQRRAMFRLVEEGERPRAPLPPRILAGRVLLAAWLAWTGTDLVTALMRPDPAGEAWIDVGICAGLMLLGLGVAARRGILGRP